MENADKCVDTKTYFDYSSWLFFLVTEFKDKLIISQSEMKRYVKATVDGNVVGVFDCRENKGYTEMLNNGEG